MKKTLCCFLCLIALFALPLSAAARRAPKLVLAVVIDQFRYDYLLRFRDQYTSGFARILSEGAFFRDAHYVHYPTVTAIGHSTFLSGATPSVSGIVGNEWYDRATRKMVTSVSDPDTKLLGAGRDSIGSSPRRFLVSTVGDELKMDGKGGKVIGISMKDRAAILPSGHMADAAYWFDDKSNHFVSSTYYFPTLPDWVEQFDEAGPAKPYEHAKWEPIDARKSDAKPFCAMDGASGVKKCGSLADTPFGNDVVEAFAEKAIAAEKLGRHEGTDLLTVSFSANDHVGHAVGPDAPEMRDITIRTDRVLGKLIAFAEAHAGAGNVLFVLTGDHGVSPVPEVNEARKMPGGRVSGKAILEQMRDALSKQFGPGDWVLGNSDSLPYLNYDLIREKHLDPAAVENAAAEALRAMPHVARVYTRDQLAKGQVQGDPVSRAIENGFNSERSPDLSILLDPYFIPSASAHGTTHGTPYNYDNHVPIVFWGTGIKAGNYYEPVIVNDIAPTLTALLGVNDPSGSIGRVLSEMFAPAPPRVTPRH